MKTASISRKKTALYLMLAIPLLYFIIFRYLPLVGLVVAFKKYNIFQGIFDSPWIGFGNFQDAFTNQEFWKALGNTLILNIGDLIINFPFPIILAVLLNEMRWERTRKVTQTVLYLPHFLSTVVVVGIVQQVFGPRGFVNGALGAMGMQAVNFLGDNNLWRVIYWVSGLWTGAGYGMIVYLAAIAGINVELYDAAYIDGAGRWGRIWHVTLPQIRPTIVTMLVMNVGKVLSIGFERPYLMGNTLVKDVSNVISTYVYTVGLQAGRYDFATAVGLFQSVAALALVLLANMAAKKLGEEGIM